MNRRMLVPLTVLWLLAPRLADAQQKPPQPSDKQQDLIRQAVEVLQIQEQQERARQEAEASTAQRQTKLYEDIEIMRRLLNRKLDSLPGVSFCKTMPRSMGGGIGGIPGGHRGDAR